MHKAFRIIIGCAIIVGSFAAGVGAIFQLHILHALDEAKVAEANLRFRNDKLTPQTREYLKERLYWNVCMFIPKSYLVRWDFDYGPIDETALNGIRGIKDGSSAEEVYCDALKKLDPNILKEKTQPQPAPPAYSEPGNGPKK